EEDLDLLETQPEKVHAEAYDLVLNGYELGGGSKRIHKRDIQNRMLKVRGFSEEDANEEFGLLVEALHDGAPSHGGSALALDRLVMLLAAKHILRDTILFPIPASATDPLTDAPKHVTNAQLIAVGIRLHDQNTGKTNKYLSVQLLY